MIYDKHTSMTHLLKILCEIKKSKINITSLSYEYHIKLHTYTHTLAFIYIFLKCTHHTAAYHLVVAVNLSWERRLCSCQTESNSSVHNRHF